MATILFDLDGVLIRSRYPDRSFLWSKNLEKDLQIPADLSRKLYTQPEWHSIITGKADFRTRIADLFGSARATTTSEEFIDYWLTRDLNWYADTLQFAQELKSMGHSLSIATNQDAIRGQFIRKQREVRDLFSDVFTSADLGFAKPEPLFFEQVRSRLDLRNPRELILIDDDSRNTQAAAAAGWSALCYNPDLDPQASIAVLRESLRQILHSR